MSAFRGNTKAVAQTRRLKGYVSEARVRINIAVLGIQHIRFVREARRA